MLLGFPGRKGNRAEPLKNNGFITQGNLKNWTCPLLGNENPGSKYSRTKNHRLSLILQSSSPRFVLLSTSWGAWFIIYSIGMMIMETAQHNRDVCHPKKNARKRWLLFDPHPMQPSFNHMFNNYLC